MIEARVLTFNTLYKGDLPARLRGLGAVLERSDYDVVCLQELWNPVALPLLRSATPSYPHAAHARRLPLLPGGLAILSRHPLTHTRFTAYSRYGGLRREMLSRKGVLSARVHTPQGPFAIVNTHVSANSSGVWTPGDPFMDVQKAELRELAVEIAKVRTREPLVAVGDFNVPRDSWLFEEFVAISGLVDAFDGSGETTFRPTPRWAGKALDQLLVSPGGSAVAGLALVDAVTLPNGREAFLSDHYGVEASVSLAADAI